MLLFPFGVVVVFALPAGASPNLLPVAPVHVHKLLQFERWAPCFFVFSAFFNRPLRWHTGPPHLYVFSLFARRVPTCVVSPPLGGRVSLFPNPLTPGISSSWHVFLFRGSVVIARLLFFSFFCNKPPFGGDVPFQIPTGHLFSFQPACNFRPTPHFPAPFWCCGLSKDRRPTHLGLFLPAVDVCLSFFLR